MKTAIRMLTALFATLVVTSLPCLGQPASADAAEPPVHPAPAAHAWAPKHAALMTRWAAQVDPRAPLPEYPRPQMVRAEWQNLNGIWQYQPGAEGDATPTGKMPSSEIPSESLDAHR